MRPELSIEHKKARKKAYNKRYHAKNKVRLCKNRMERYYREKAIKQKG